MSSTSDNESTDSAMEAPVTQKNFSFKLKTYPAEFKLQAVNDAKLTNNSVSARKHGVDVRCIRRWVGQQSAKGSNFLVVAKDLLMRTWKRFCFSGSFPRGQGH